ncbi:uncharacterized protein UV8b_04906 [Ustilaginoidea virens]|uniref:CFEM domain-containing protein n=1 Tax=Ustilaginoidea virens TaxID=1159556 RepID=A0A8E5HS75_USTVR|nr:uncharacterized protein UV8b_04906 [Ustilaginoidea virens]QUC20665.1 hypothetical protein UV8b_04906 [Ustilaginoidea virens]
MLACGASIAAQETASTASPSFLADVVSKLPACAVDCFGKLSKPTACLPTDKACLCADKDMLASVAACVLEDCTAKESILAKKTVAEGCNEPVRDKNKTYMTISDTFGIISGLVVIQRFAFKLWAKQDFGLDDWFALATIVTGAPSTVINTYGVGANGIGRDVWTLELDQISKFGKYFFIMEILYFVQIALVKLALLFFFLRIFPARNVRRLLWGTVVFTIAYALVFALVGIFTCSPVSYLWTRWDQEHDGTCLDINAIVLSNAVIGIAIDCWILAIPMWQLNGLNMQWRQKLSVAAMFLLGTFVTVVSMLRLQSLVRFGYDSINPTWDFFDVSVWSCIEVNVGIWCVCMPSLRLLLVRLCPSWRGSSARSYTRYGSSVNQGDKSHQNKSLGPSATATSHFDRVHGRLSGGIKGNQICYQKSYKVEVSDADEMALVSVGGNESRTGSKRR